VEPTEAPPSSAPGKEADNSPPKAPAP
jgi:hypothetical protein